VSYLKEKDNNWNVNEEKLKMSLTDGAAAPVAPSSRLP
jgi:hypothetical protein